jgi:riboflavin biosynthesis pyrimidine reductase
MVTSVDGTTVVDGRSGGLGSATDSAVLRALRASADVVIVGSTTAHAERYGPPRKSGQRVGVVTNTGRVDPSLPLFASGAGFLITTDSAPTHGLPAIRSGHATVNLEDALAQLDADVVHAEGGPTLNAALHHADLVDEVNLTMAPRLIGGSGQRLTGTSPHETVRDLELTHVCSDNGFLFLRYVRADHSGSRTT